MRLLWQRMSLRTRILSLLSLYATVLAAAILLQAHSLNEATESQVAASLLDFELTQFKERAADDPNYQWRGTHELKLYGNIARNGINTQPPDVLKNLSAGTHVDVLVGGLEQMVLVDEQNGERLILSLDINEIETREQGFILRSLLISLGSILLFSLILAWALGRALQPLKVLNDAISTLSPEQQGTQIERPTGASPELLRMVDTLNDYLLRNAQFVERERAFINSASHELRTPIAVISGASQLALDQIDQLSNTPATARKALLRLQQTAKEVEQLITLLLMLAKNPDRLAEISDPIDLNEILPDIIASHEHLCKDKRLAIVSHMTAVSPSLRAPLVAVRSAIGNLLRNAIEHSDQGEITVRVATAPTQIIIDDPGHGMSPQEISQLYARLARSEGRVGDGIGLELIAKLCTHLGWQLQLSPRTEGGTRANLRFE